jgi:hypothetical protein
MKQTSYKENDSIHSVVSATPLLSITALFREPKAREDHPTLIKKLITTLKPSPLLNHQIKKLPHSSIPQQISRHG